MLLHNMNAQVTRLVYSPLILALDVCLVLPQVLFLQFQLLGL